jgi:ribosome-binding factor A
MADDRRIQRIQSRIRQDVADMFLSELKDPRMRGVISITRVKVSKDLTNARIFYSVLGTDADRRSVERFMLAATPKVQMAVAKGLRIRVLPKLVFQFDDAIEKQMAVTNLIDQALAADKHDPDDE